MRKPKLKKAIAARGVTAALDSVTDGTERNAGVAAIIDTTGGAAASTHAAITENKRLSEVLAYAKALQDAAPPKVNTVGKQKTRYEPNGKKSPGRRSWLDKRAERRAEEAAQGTGQVSDV